MRTLNWAIYLAVSWTWCIGMFLPNLLVRDQGKLGFLAFFIPNVIGAASVGWLLSTKAKSERFVEITRPVVLAFTAVTISFHGYWIAWRCGAFSDTPVLLGGIAAGCCGVVLLTLAQRRVGVVAAVFTLLCSIGAGVALLSDPMDAPTGLANLDLVGLLAVCVLGFGLCPYLDVTFNRVCQLAPSPRAAFTLGFFVFFAATILLTTHGRTLWSGGVDGVEMASWVLPLLLGMHYGAQATFTVSAHVSVLRTTGSVQRIVSSEWMLLTVGAGAIGVLLGVLVHFVPLSVGSHDGGGTMFAPEVGYRMYLGAYGLVFPIWMIAALRRGNSVDRPVLLVSLLACVLAGPFFLYASVRGREAWYLPGVALAVILPLLTPRAQKAFVSSPTASSPNAS